MSDTPHPEHTHNWSGTRNHCTLCEKWCVDAETERRVRADERRRVLGEVERIINRQSTFEAPDADGSGIKLFPMLDEIKEMKEG